MMNLFRYSTISNLPILLNWNNFSQDIYEAATNTRTALFEVGAPFLAITVFYATVYFSALGWGSMTLDMMGFESILRESTVLWITLAASPIASGLSMALVKANQVAYGEQGNLFEKRSFQIGIFLVFTTSMAIALTLLKANGVHVLSFASTMATCGIGVVSFVAVYGSILLFLGLYLEFCSTLPQRERVTDYAEYRRYPRHPCGYSGLPGHPEYYY